MIDYKTLVSTLSVNGNHAQILFVRAIRVEVKLISNTEHGKVLLYKYCDQRCNGDVTVKDVICNGVLHEDQQTPFLRLRVVLLRAVLLRNPNIIR